MSTQTAGFLNILTSSRCVYTVDEVLLGVSRAGSKFPHPNPSKRSSSSRSFSKDKYFFLHFVSFGEKKPTCISLIYFFFIPFQNVSACKQVTAKSVTSLSDHDLCFAFSSVTSYLPQTIFVFYVSQITPSGFKKKF